MTDTLNPMTDAAASAIDRSAADVVADLTLEEKASLTSGASFWTTKPLERVGLPAIMLTDGPHGVRKQRASADHLGIGDSVPATCFPPAVALGSSFDPELLERVGVALGEEAQAEGVGVLLGPGINIKRSPLCGRNFEYLSEDPIVSGVLGSGARARPAVAGRRRLAQALRRQQPGGRPHARLGRHRRAPAARDLPARLPARRRGRAAVDRHVLVQPPQRRLHLRGPLAAHQGAARRVGLRRPRRLRLGRGRRARRRPRRRPRPRDAVERGPHRCRSSSPPCAAGVLDESAARPAARRNVELVQKAVRGARADAAYDADAHHALAREVAGASIVLLKNDDGVLPLAAGRIRRRHRRARPHAALPGRRVVADQPDAARQRARRDPRARRRRGAVRGRLRRRRRDLRRARRRGGRPRHPPPGPCCSSSACPRPHESEGFDRDDIELPAAQLALLDAVIAANPRTVVVLSNGGVVRLSGFAERVPAIVEGWLLGQAGGGAVADVLYGAVNPSGRLAETIPVRLADSPAVPRLPRRALARALRRGPVRRLPLVRRARARGRLPVRARPVVHDVRVLGCLGVGRRLGHHGARHRDEHRRPRRRRGRAGLHVAARLGRGSRAPRELKGFAKVALAAGESREVEVHVRRERPRATGTPASTAGSSRAASTRSRSGRRAATSARPPRSTSTATACACRSR